MFEKKDLCGKNFKKVNMNLRGEGRCDFFNSQLTQQGLVYTEEGHIQHFVPQLTA